MKVKNLFRQWLFKRRLKKLPPLSAEINSVDWDKVREEGELKAKNAKIPKHIVCKSIDLKVDDVIIHNYSKFKVLECGCGFGAGNEFGNYFWIKGKFVRGNPTDPKPLKRFWAFQECPVIKLL